MLLRQHVGFRHCNQNVHLHLQRCSYARKPQWASSLHASSCNFLRRSKQSIFVRSSSAEDPNTSSSTGSPPTSPSQETARASTSEGTTKGTSSSQPGEQGSGSWQQLLQQLKQVAAAVALFLASFFKQVQQLPVWLRAQELKRLKEKTDEDPKDPGKHAQYLAALNKSNASEVIRRVESKEVGAGHAAWGSRFLHATAWSPGLPHHYCAMDRQANAATWCTGSAHAAQVALNTDATISSTRPRAAHGNAPH